MNKITFIIPSLNRKTLKDTVNSIINQSNPNWNCIIIYDGVKGQKFKDDRIKTIQIKKTGVEKNELHHGMSGLVRNYGLEICDTEWVGFVDDDDTIHENYVETLFEKYNSYDLVIWRMVNDKGLIIPRNNTISYGNVGISFCYKNKYNIRFDNNRDGEDFDFIEKLISATNNFIITDEIFYYFK
jgi:glycosyltransferase involved in cell wall biosynthesis